MYLRRCLKSGLAVVDGQKAKNGTRMHSNMCMKRLERRFGSSKVVCAHHQNCASYMGGEHFFVKTKGKNEIDLKKERKCSGEK